MAEDQPEFNENIELFKLQVLSEDERASHNTMTAAFLALFIAYAIYLMQTDHELITYYVALTLGGLGWILVLLISQSIPHGRFIQRMNDYIRQVQRRERLPDMIDLYNTGRWIRLLVARRTAGEPAASTNRQR